MDSNNTFIDRIIQNRIISHLIFWGGFLLVFTMLDSLNSGSIRSNLANYLALLPAQMMAAYLLVYYQIPKILLKKKYLYFVLSFLLSAYLFALVARLSIIYIAEPFYRVDFEQESLREIISDPFYLISVYFPVVYVFVFLMLAMKSIKDRFEEKHQLQVLLKEKATSELKFLKAQIQPHFLFNTLNNLYALTLAKSDAAPQVVVKLSEILDYMLYQCNEPRVDISKEISLLQGYLDLEMLRYGNNFDLVFDHKMDQSNIKIAPLILISIVENAFKHGVRKNPKDPKIHINLAVENGELNFKVFNKKPKNFVPNHTDNNRNGIGTTNINRQLELNYPNNYQLNIEDKEDAYLVVLKINLN